MATLDLSRPQFVHVVAIGGAAMNAIALILHQLGHRVTGSDDVDTPFVRGLRDRGISVSIGYDAGRVRGADLVAISSGVTADNPEVAAATAAGIPIVSRPDLQGAIASLRDTVAVAGTHGKTTTTAMLALALRDAGMDPAFLVGGVVGGIETGSHWSDSGWFVVEADESDGTFLALNASAVIVTNVEADHLDHWGDLEALRAAFARFVAGASGPRVICADDPGAAALAEAVGGCTTYGTAANADYRLAGDVVHCPDGATVPVRVPIPGVHNARNATAAFAMADLLGADRLAVSSSLAAFPGVGRRFERRGEVGGIVFIDSYDHLPTEVKAVLAATKDSYARVVCVFQPHRYTRTRDLHGDFADAFDDADVVAITDIYAAGQHAMPGVTGKLVVDSLLAARPWKRVAWLPKRRDLHSWLVAELKPGDLCLTLGAGDLTTLPDELIAALRMRVEGPGAEP